MRANRLIIAVILLSQAACGYWFGRSKWFSSASGGRAALLPKATRDLKCPAQRLTTQALGKFPEYWAVVRVGGCGKQKIYVHSLAIQAARPPEDQWLPLDEVAQVHPNIRGGKLPRDVSQGPMSIRSAIRVENHQGQSSRALRAADVYVTPQGLFFKHPDYRDLILGWHWIDIRRIKVEFWRWQGERLVMPGSAPSAAAAEVSRRSRFSRDGGSWSRARSFSSGVGRAADHLQRAWRSDTVTINVDPRKETWTPELRGKGTKMKDLVYLFARCKQENALCEKPYW